jgi:putative flippase GtrA
MTTTPLVVELRTGRRPAADVEIVIPVLDEEEVLERSIRRLVAYLEDRFPLSWLVTIVDNASTDRTWGIACRLAGELDGVQAVHLDRKGRGLALRTAWARSTAPVVAYMDVDLSTDLDALLPLVAPLLSGHSDLAIGTRLAAASQVVRGPAREAISRAYNLLLRTTLHSGFSDAQCGFKAARGEVARALLPLVEDDGWFFDTELLVLAEHNGLRIHEVPVDWVDDPDSRVDIVSTATADLHGIWRMACSIARGRADLRSHATHDDRGGPAGTPATVGRVPREPTSRGSARLASQLVSFASVGVVSTVVFGALFLVLAGPLGAVAANIVALAVCTVANTAANRRLTFSLRGRAGRARHQLAGLALAALPLALTLAALAVAGSAGVRSVGAQLAILTGAYLVAALGRFFLLRHWVFRMDEPSGGPRDAHPPGVPRAVPPAGSARAPAGGDPTVATP